MAGAKDEGSEEDALQRALDTRERPLREGAQGEGGGGAWDAYAAA